MIEPAADALGLFLPAVGDWFRRSLGEPTPVQRAGWPVIAAGQSALLLAPTGSGKTLAAFLACLDHLWRQPELPPGVRVLYISPLKALNNDIYRNLQVPLLGVAETAAAAGGELPRIDVAVRTGDTPAAERQRLLRRPPHVLITTPESLHLLLTSRARDVLRGITHCIVDEIHALCPNKRGVFLSLLLERLAALNPAGFARVGLSATQRPLELVAQFLGGLDDAGEPRPVSIVNAGLRKDLDLRVVSPVEQFGAHPEASIWPSIYHLLAREIRQHRSTIVFANNRRSVERLTAQLNDYLSDGEDDGEAAPILVRAHHGSVSLDVRRATEEALKEGRLRAVVATASLELGIDMGAVDLVCQVESPGSVSRGLQRVGRAGHLVGQQSKGRLVPKTLPDLLGQAVLAAEMAAGRVEELRVPTNCLDVLAQQVVAMVAMEDWDVAALYRLVRRAYPYRDLTPGAFDAVLEMATGRYLFAEEQTPSPGAVGPRQRITSLQPRVSWDRVHQRLQALPGSQRLALANGGTIPDTGQYAVYTLKGLRVGEVDEEFVYERRIGDSFLLGTNAWRINRIETDRVVVQPADGAPAMVPYWRGEMVGRSYDLSLAQGRFLAELARRLDDSDCLAWLERDYFLDPAAAANLRDFVRRQLRKAGAVPTDRAVVVEASRDSLGDWQVIVHCPLGGRFNYGLRLAMENVLERRLGYRPQCLHHDDGVLIRLSESDEPVTDVFEGVTAENVRDLVLDELADSALFALRFRQNAARALLMPRGGAGKRAPLWLQRLRGRDLLQVARRYPGFPIVAETFRECLHDHLELPRLEQWLTELHAGQIEVRTCRLEGPSPFAAGLLFAFAAAKMYQYDGVEAGGSGGALDLTLLDEIVAGDGQHITPDARAIRQVDRFLRGVGRPPRSVAEMAEWLRRVGDVSAGQLEGQMPDFLRELETEGRVRRITLRNCDEPGRWILTEEAELYDSVFANPAPDEAARHSAATVLRRYLETHALVGLDDVLRRYPFEPDWARRQLEEWADAGRLVRVTPAEGPGPLQWSAPENYEQIERGTLSLLRREVVTCPPAQFADFVTRWQHAHPDHRAENVGAVLETLQGVSLPAELWEQSVLPARVRDYQPRRLDEAVSGGRWTWACRGDADRDEVPAAFFDRELLGVFPPPDAAAPAGLAEQLLGLLGTRGALYSAELAQHAGSTISAVRSALWSLVRLGLVTNDLFQVLRQGQPVSDEGSPHFRSHRGLVTFLKHSRQRREAPVTEGRWSLLPWGRPDAEAAAASRARLLLGRFGVVARELAQTDATMPPWRVLYEVLSRMELAGEVRRGYFVEGLSGAQFALPEAMQQLQALGHAVAPPADPALLHSLDPANLYGSGAPFDLALLEGGERAFLRRAGNWLVVQAGRPVLLIEQQGRRLTALPSAGVDDLARAVARLPSIRAGRGKLSVETWNEQPVTSTPGKELLEQVGFVRDYQAMTLYASWS